MPQLIVLAVAGAGLLAGYKWLAKKVAAHVEAEKARAETERQQAEKCGVPKEMGALEWDIEAQVYRPARR